MNMCEAVLKRGICTYIGNPENAFRKTSSTDVLHVEICFREVSLHASFGLNLSQALRHTTKTFGCLISGNCLTRRNRFCDDVQ